MTDIKYCPDCAVAPGKHHERGCDVERCPRCGHQAISCNCIYEINGMDIDTLEEKHPEIFGSGPTDEMVAKWDELWGARRMVWSGEWPGVAECREYGFWALGPPWRSVPAGTPGATEHLNQLYTECVWDPDAQKMVRRQPVSR